MDLDKWLEEMEQLIEQVRKITISKYPSWSADGFVDQNKICPPANAGLLKQLQDRVDGKISPQFIQFYQKCDGIELMYVWNGYITDPVSWLVENYKHPEIPSRITGDKPGPILTFGNDGGGNFFAIRLDGQGEVLYLNHELLHYDVKSVTYHNVDELPLYFPVLVLAKDFFGFLERLMADTKAHVNDPEHKGDWKYMDHDL